MERKRKKEKDIGRRGKKKKRYHEKDIKIMTLIAITQVFSAHLISLRPHYYIINIPRIV